MTKRSKNAATSAEMGAVLAQQAAQAKEMHYPGLDQLKAADALQNALQNALQDATVDGVGFTKVTFSDEEGVKVEHISRAEFLEGGSYGNAAAMTRDMELLDRRLGTFPNWAVNTPDPHAPWPDPRPEPASDAHGMDFGDAIRCLKRGQRVQRAGWNGKGMWLEYVSDAEMGPLALRLEPFISMFTAQQKRIPWLASQADVLADDWRVVG